MMDHFVIATQFRVFIFDRIKTMRTTGYYLFNIITVQYLYIHHSLHLEQELITRTFGRVTGAVLFGTQNRKADTHMIQYLANITRDTLCTFVKAAGATYPE